MADLLSAGTISTILIGLVTYYLVNLVMAVRTLPPGPWPLPVCGNLLSFKSKIVSTSQVMGGLRQKYGDVFTVWFGSVPFVVINSWEFAKEALVVKKNDFAGRIRMYITDQLIKDGTDIAMSDYGEEYEILKKLGHAAVRKHVTSEKLPTIVSEVVDNISKRIATEKVLKPKDHMYLIVYAVTAISALGFDYEDDKEEYLKLKTVNEELRILSENGFPGDFIPMLRPFLYRKRKTISTAMATWLGMVKRKFRDRMVTYVPGEVRDFSDVVLSLRDSAKLENPYIVPFLTDNNLRMVVSDLFSAGFDTTLTTLSWIFLFITHHQDIQEKMYQEISDNIGTRVAVQEDWRSCHYVWAVIAEVLRLRTIVPLGLPHKTTRDTELAGHKIPRGTAVLFNLDGINKCPKAWKNPEDCVPERFLDDDGKYNTLRVNNFVPFGLGRRSCIGEKLARITMFLIIVRLLQNFKFRFALGDKVTLEPQSKAVSCEPYAYELVALPRNN